MFLKLAKTILRPLKRIVNCARDRDVMFKPSKKYPVERHGSDYGGWCLVRDSLAPDSIVLSAGLGHDISFDRSVIDKYGCKVIGYDPDPRARAYHVNTIFPDGFEWRNEGWGRHSGTMRMFRPHRSDWISGTTISGAIKHDKEFDEVAIVGIDKVLCQYQTVDVLKMDIEGAEYEVIDEILATGSICKLNQLLVEFHHGMGCFRGSDTAREVRKILGAGFDLFWVSEGGHEFGFVKKGP